MKEFCHGKEIREYEFDQKWNKYFPGAFLPIGFYYTDLKEKKGMLKPPKGHRCIIADLASVSKGNTRRFDIDAIGCGGGRRYLGFEDNQAPNFEYFLLRYSGKTDGGKITRNRQNLLKRS